MGLRSQAATSGTGHAVLSWVRMMAPSGGQDRQDQEPSQRRREGHGAGRGRRRGTYTDAWKATSRSSSGHARVTRSAPRLEAQGMQGTPGTHMVGNAAERGAAGDKRVVGARDRQGCSGLATAAAAADIWRCAWAAASRLAGGHGCMRACMHACRQASRPGCCCRGLGFAGRRGSYDVADCPRARGLPLAARIQRVSAAKQVHPCAARREPPEQVGPPPRGGGGG